MNSPKKYFTLNADEIMQMIESDDNNSVSDFGW